ncbi:hypothetical protein A1351_03145 [Methylosinus sp. R-45379]|nr:hypothetical protein A1351_03145 [Methylosinus sp. R-45379]
METLARARARAKVIGDLHPHPGVGRSAESLLEPQRHFRRESVMTVDQSIELLPRHAEPLRRLGDAQAQLLDIVSDEPTGMGRIFHHRPRLHQ